MSPHDLVGDDITEADEFGRRSHLQHLIVGGTILPIATQIALLDKQRHNGPVEEENVLFLVDAEMLGLLRIHQLETCLEVVHHLSLVLLALVGALIDQCLVVSFLRLRP